MPKPVMPFIAVEEDDSADIEGGLHNIARTHLEVRNQVLLNLLAH